MERKEVIATLSALSEAIDNNLAQNNELTSNETCVGIACGMKAAINECISLLDGTTNPDDFESVSDMVWAPLLQATRNTGSVIRGGSDD